MIDPLELSRALIRCPSVTPEDAGALDVLTKALEGIGFTCRRLKFSTDGTPDVDNLYARIGSAAPNFCFAGHTDVVPAGDGWSHGPFDGAVSGDRLYGRGAADMKGAIACFVAAASRFIKEKGVDFGGSISLMITGDEEGPAVNGTARILEWAKEQGETIDDCVVGEPTNPKQMGDLIKIGRRGSLNGRLTVYGTQGHTAYPELADNPIPRLMRMMTVLNFAQLDDGVAKYFDPTRVAITSFDVGNPTTNMIPSKAAAAFNIRFNDKHTGERLIENIKQRFDKEQCRYELETEISGEAFLTRPGPLSKLVSAAVEKVTGRTPDYGTGGGTSDARFIKNYCPVVEFGLIAETAHKVDEHVAVADLATLTGIYQAVLDGYFQEGR
ncbi:MAG: succinyl-diaminopimelate desuccinylase [Rhodospirillales bacterium RIFCSPLOWO2_12_FULL_58_28]|nr:MAG: succinyl-diaminopimelate desuccinylase [Rhodospirillales bacterium RIFCSPLOWO2_02_FULL_58_16]OHC77438.1 MAG: succinyl-diaminopimelate desuccinylase [Rhodospirillales bacterium RIFCSPLOWO2_12_FULL_58_28]